MKTVFTTSRPSVILSLLASDPPPHTAMSTNAKLTIETLKELRSSQSNDKLWQVKNTHIN